MFRRFLPSARQAMEDAMFHAGRLDQPEVRPEHLLLALASGGGATARLLGANGLTPASIESAIKLTIALETEAGPLTQGDAEALRTIGIDLGQVRGELERLGPEVARPATRRRQRGLGTSLPLSCETKKALGTALKEARDHGHRYLAAEHVLLGVLGGKQGVAVEVLDRFDVTAEALRTQLISRLRRAS